jgi:hypothetical protein
MNARNTVRTAIHVAILLSAAQIAARFVVRLEATVRPGATLLAAALIALAYSLFFHWSESRVFRPSGWNLRRFAELCFSKKTFTKVLEPVLSDMQKEHFEALAASRRWKALMVLVRGYWSFWSAVVAQLPISFARRVYEVWKATKTG